MLIALINEYVAPEGYHPLRTTKFYMVRIMRRQETITLSSFFCVVCMCLKSSSSI